MKTALITGSSRGIGKAIALRLARDGFRVIVHSSGKTDKANAVASEILKNGGEAEVVSANLCDVSQTEQLRKAAEKADVLILNQSKGVNIEKDYLPIALCAQHNNGGVAVDLWWQSGVKGLLAAGECAGTHGVTRPGGSALNAGQVGSLRAAQYISHMENRPDETAFDKALKKVLPYCETLLEGAERRPDTVEQHIKACAERMSEKCGAVRNIEQMREAKEETERDWEQLPACVGISDKSQRYRLFVLRSVLATSLAVLTACLDYAETVGKSRGSAFYTDEKGTAGYGLGDRYRFSVETDRASYHKIQEVFFRNGKPVTVWRNVRPMPQEDDFFENVWRQYRENKNIY